MQKNELVERLIITFQKRLGYDKEEKRALGISSEDAKAEVIRRGNKITIIPKKGRIYTPDFIIENADLLNKVLERYLDTVEKTDIKSTKMDNRHTREYFLFNIWKNAAMYDFANPAAFINRYTNFISDTTFSEYDDETFLGRFNGLNLTAQRKEDEYGFETPFIFQYVLSNESEKYHFPLIRYGISSNRVGEKVAYIYALQESFEDETPEFRKKIIYDFNRINKGVKRYRNVSPSAIISLSMFLGMLESYGISYVKAPDFLVGRYSHFTRS